MLPRRGLLAVLLASPALSGLWLRSRPAAALSETPRRTALIELNAAGSYYYGVTMERAALLVGRRVQLRRAPHNPHDALAIELWVEGAQVGHVPRPHNELLARLLDAGDRVEGRVVGADEGARPLRVGLERVGGSAPAVGSPPWDELQERSLRPARSKTPGSARPDTTSLDRPHIGARAC